MNHVAARLAPMPGIRAILSALVAATCALALAACGADEEGPIPQEDGELLLTQLEQIEDEVQAMDCEAARATAAEFAQTVDQLPSEVDGALRQGLVEASANLEALSEDPEQCVPEGGTGQSGVVAPDPAAEEPAPTTTDEAPTEEDTDDDGGGGDSGQGNGPPDRPPGGGNGNPGGGNGSSGGDGDDGSSGGIGSDG